MVKLVFDEELGTLQRDNKIIGLGKFSTRCLALLLKHEDTVVTKDMLLNEGWVKHGLMVSDTSVRQALVNIRKVFLELDVQNDVLKTVPKKGYCLKSGVLVIKKDVLEIAHGVKEQNYAQAPSRHLSGSLKTYLLASILLLSLVLNVGVMLWRHQSLMPEIQYKDAGQEGEVHYFMQQNMMRERFVTLKNLLDKYIKSGDVSLQFIHYVYVNNTQFKGHGSYFLCRKTIGNHDQCHSVVILSDK